MFCKNCGTKVPDGANFCQKCGAKLMVDTAENMQMERSAWQAQMQPGQNPIGASGKKKRKKWPVILSVAGGILCLLMILAAMGGNDSPPNPSQQNATKVNDAETYTNEEEGI